ncbi:MAG TPA: VWA domain-containing protein [Vicinamibacterales bacterium]|jgi:VWFA-related protein
MRRAALVLLLASVALASPAAQQPAQPTFRTGANYVRVDVYPTRNGMPVDDLRRDDFELLDDKVPQTIDDFEHVVVRSAGPQETRREPNTVAESRQAALEPRARVFVLFLDVTHVELAASRKIRTPLVEALDRLIGADDLIAVMTPEMSARDITFARRTTTIEGFLTRSWWGERDQLNFKDPVEDLYARCYPGIPRPGEATAPDQGIAQEMILRRREKRTLDALDDLVRFLGGVREERKAIITITDGWRLYERNGALARPIDGQVPTGPVIGINPATGTLGTRPPESTGRTSSADCERDRFALSQLDDAQQFRYMLDEANRANASFYPIDPRGLVVFDEDIVPAAGVGAGINANPTISPAEDRSRLFARNTSLRTLAEATDGLAVLNTNDLSRGLRRIVDDLSSYYLLGYYSTGKLDGRFHAISVRVKRPGVQVRARRGYLANTEAAAASASAAAAPTVSPAAAANARAIESALASLGTAGRELPVRVHATAGWTPANAATVWAVAEIGRAAQEDWAGGGQADAMLIDGSGRTVAAGRAQIAPGATSARIALTSNTLVAGDYELQLRTKGARASAAGSDVLRISVPAAPQATSALFFRRGPATANREMPTADLRFRRSERLRVDVPTPAAGAVTARVLDRNGNALPIPVTATVRDDPDGSRWQSAEVSLAPLAPADYLLELASPASRTLLAFRVIP